jgi:hypothetical protein
MPNFPLRLVVSQIVAAAAEELEREGKKVGIALELWFCEPFDVKKACAFGDCTYSMDAIRKFLCLIHV